jgi:hypothetical protein
VFATPPEDDPLYEYKHSKSYEFGVERFGGKATVLGNQISDALTALFTGPNLGLSIGVIAVIVALLYFGITRRRLVRATRKVL